MTTVLTSLAFFNSTWDWLIILLILLLLFGSRLPKVARNLGQGINEFKKGLSEGDGATPPPSDQPPASTPRPVQREAVRKSDISDTSV